MSGAASESSLPTHPAPALALFHRLYHHPALSNPSPKHASHSRSNPARWRRCPLLSPLPPQTLFHFPFPVATLNAHRAPHNLSPYNEPTLLHTPQGSTPSSHRTEQFAKDQTPLRMTRGPSFHLIYLKNEECMFTYIMNVC